MPDRKLVKRFEKDGPTGVGLTEWPAMNPATLVSGTPVQTGHLYDEDPQTDYSVGVWECAAFVNQPGPYPVDEFMLLLEGTVEMALPDGNQITVNVGEAFIIPKGFECQWKMPGTVRKFFMILDGEAPGDAHNASLNRITKPDLTAMDVPKSGAIGTRTTYFANHDGRMQVYIDTFADQQNTTAPQQGRHMIHVLSGQVAFRDDDDLTFVSRESFYLLPSNRLHWEIAAGTRLLVSRCDLPA